MKIKLLLVLLTANLYAYNANERSCQELTEDMNFLFTKGTENIDRKDYHSALVSYKLSINPVKVYRAKCCKALPKKHQATCYENIDLTEMAFNFIRVDAEMIKENEDLK